jgi:hypothetical protein
MTSALFQQKLTQINAENQTSDIQCHTIADAIALLNHARPMINALGTQLTFPLTPESQAGMIFLVGLNEASHPYLPTLQGVHEDESNARITITGTDNIETLKGMGLLFPGRFAQASHPNTGMQR